MTTFKQFAAKLDNMANELDGFASDQAVKCARIIAMDLIDVTPIDTTNAVSNWQVSLGAPVLSERGPYFPGVKRSTAGLSQAAARAAVEAVLAQKKPGQPIFISNLAPYIKRLNEGYSKQAPAGFVEYALLLGRRFIADVKLKGGLYG